MRLINQKNDAVLADSVKITGSFAGRLRGLMFSHSFPVEYGALIVTPCNSVHTMFMRYPIDVLFVDRSWRVLHCCHMLIPWRISRIVRGASAAVELPAGTLARSFTRKGDILSHQ
jgi:uncharacterized protein